MRHGVSCARPERRVLAGIVGLLLVLSTLAPGAAGADDTVPYRHYTVRDGLPHETIHSLAQGPDGRLWIGTAAGLAVYDGHSIRRVPLPDSLGAPRVLDLLPRPSGTSVGLPRI